MPSAGFETVIPATKRLQTYALDRAVTGIGNQRFNVSPIHLLALLGVGNFTKWSACQLTAYEVVRDCPDFEKH
jgi:hypothetical protein